MRLFLSVPALSLIGLGVVLAWIAYAIGFPTGFGWPVEVHDVAAALVGVGIYKAIWE